jgi:CheY-like chemotaxis protein
VDTITLKNILLADDDADDRLLFEEALKTVSPDSELTFAHNGLELMQVLERYTPDIIFLDINMPLKNGIDCIKWIRDLKQFRNLSVVAYSSAFNSEEINKAYAFGVHLYFIKPTRLRFLVEDLEYLFELDWNDPNTITSDHFTGSSYRAFNPQRVEC